MLKILIILRFIINTYVNKCFLLLIILCLYLHAQITLQGFTPKGIDKPTVQYEYKRIYTTLAPKKRIDRSPITITFYSTTVQSNSTYSLPEWGGGGAIGTDAVVVCIDKKPFLEHTPYQVTVHELVHIVINRLCRDIAVPRWFHEGLAMTLSGDATDREDIVLSKALFTGSIMPLQAIDSVNSFGRFRAELAYCQSRQAVRYLIDTYGIEVIVEIVEAVNEAGSFWDGFYEVLQLSERELEIYYRKFIMKHHGKFFWLLDTYLVWAGIVLLFLCAYLITVIRIKKKRAVLEAEDALSGNGVINEKVSSTFDINNR